MSFLGAWKRRVAVWAVLAALGVLAALLATGVLSRETGGQNAAPPTTSPAITTTAEEPIALGAADPFRRGDWGTYGGTYDQIRHSPLTQIGKPNVSQLGRVFTIDFIKHDPTIPKGQQSFPIVVNGVVYVTTANDHVFAIDGATGKVLWHYKPSGTGIFQNYGVNANRGVAYCDGKLFLLTLDMRIVSLDARTGKLVKQVAISDAVPGATTEFGYSETQAPVCYRDILLLGASGSDYGVRGFVMAYKSDLTPAWANPYWTIPPELQGWRRRGRYVGGGTNWNPVTVDPRTNTVYATTSNPSPLFNALVRRGPDPRTDSVVALDLFSGRQKWWQQQLAGDQWGYSTVQPVLLFDATLGGRKRRVVSVGTKEGVWFMYDARTGAPIFQRVKLLNHVEHPALVPGKSVTVYPASLGGLNYSPSSFDPGTGYVINSQAETAAVLRQKANLGLLSRYKVRGDVDNGLANGEFGTPPHGWKDFGSVTAVDTRRGGVAWRFVTPEPGRGGVTTTASGLGFAGGGDGVLRAFDTRTGNVLWSFQTGYQIAAAPAIYEARGKEYVAVTVGGTFTSSFGGTASQLQVFALDGDARQSPAPALRPPGPGPGVVPAPPAFLSAAAEPHTLALQVVSSMNDASGAPTFDGTSRGQMVVAVPEGWRLNVTLANHAADHGEAVAVTSAPGGTEPVFDGAHGSAPRSGVGYFSFTPSKRGRYVLTSTDASRAAAGAWLRVDVVPSGSLPLLTVRGERFAVGVARAG